MDPRPYQLDAERRVLAYAADHPTGRLLLVIPPRGGKTFVGARLVRRMALRHGLRALWLVHREELLDEAVRHLVGVGIHPGSIGVIKSGRSSDPDAKVQVASEATLDRRSRPVAHLVVTDEAHRDTASRRRRLRRAYPKAFLLGLSATPKPPPTRDLGEDYDALLVVVQPSELIHDGYLAVPTVYAPPKSETPSFRGVRIIGGDYRVEDLEPLLAEQAMLDQQVSEWARLSGGRMTVAYPVTLAHSRALCARFEAAGVRAFHLDGDTPNRREIMRGIHAGEFPVVCSAGVLSEGTNIPRLKCILGVRPTRSLVLYTQQYMRCATPWEGVVPRILDAVGNCYAHGFPFEDRRWSLVNEESGVPLGRDGGLVKRCHHCGAMMTMSASTCPGCTESFPAPAPVIPTTPLHLEVVGLEDKKRTAEWERLFAYAVEKQFTNPETWADDVLTLKHWQVVA